MQHKDLDGGYSSDGGSFYKVSEIMALSVTQRIPIYMQPSAGSYLVLNWIIASR